MKQETAKRFLKSLGASHFEERAGWVNCSCPLAPWTHKSGHDASPSFGVRLDRPYFTCFSCGAAGSLAKLLSLMLTFIPEHLRGQYDFKTAYAIAGGEEVLSQMMGDYEAPSEQKVFQPWPEHWRDQYPPAWLHSAPCVYLKGRGVRPEVRDKLDFRWDETRQMVVAPYRTAFGVLAGARGRCIHPEFPRGKQHFDYTCDKINNAKLVFYNEQAFQEEGPIIVVEGQFDAAHLLEVTPNVVANLTAKIPNEKLNKLALRNDVILMLDNDDAGYMGMHGNAAYPGAASLLMKRGARVAILDYPSKYKDPAQIPRDWLQKTLKGVVPLVP